MHLFLLVIASILLACALCGEALAAPAAKARTFKTASKTSPGVQQTGKIVKNPTGTYSLVLGAPVKTETGIVWRRLDVKDKAGKVSHVEDATKDEPGCGYELAEDGLWSPDGKYAVIYHDIYAGSNPRQDERKFLDCENATWVGFATKSGESDSLANNNGEWMAGKPHSLKLLINDKEVEALP